MRTESANRGAVDRGGGEITAALIAEMTPLLRSYCCRYLSDRTLAHDAVQETFEIALRSAHGLRDPGRIRAWLYTIARRESLRLLRAHGTPPVVEDQPDPLTPSPESQSISSDIIGAIGAGLDTLPALYRQAVVLRDVEGLTYAEIAEATGATLAAVKFRIYKGREMMMERLAPVLREWRTP
jgi:RNA polymerase sigma-70 factor (ECF subfamily)